MAFAIAARCCARRSPVANRSQMPPPKSAPPKSAYVITASPPTAAVISGTGNSLILSQPQQQQRECTSHHRVKQSKADESQSDAAYLRHSITSEHDLINRPGLATYFGYDPAGLQGKETEWRRNHERVEQPVLQCRATTIGPPVPQRDRDQRNAAAHHHPKSKVRDGDVRPVLPGHFVETADNRVGIASGQQAQTLRELDAKAHNACFRVRQTTHDEWRTCTRLEERFHRRQLDWLPIRDRTRADVAAERLQHSRNATRGQRDAQSTSVVVIASPAQQPQGIHSRRGEARCNEASQRRVQRHM